MNDSTFWWPHPDALLDLTVEDSEGGFVLSAPDHTECGAWLHYYSQNEEYHKLFEQHFTEAIRKNLEAYGQTKEFTDGLHEDGVKTEDVSAGSQS